MSKVFFISDTHFGHNNICKYRSRFTTPEEHDEFIIKNWNSVVTKAKYQVWVLGDVGIKNKRRDIKSLLSRLNGTINIITGNHCHVPYYDLPNIVMRTGLVKRYGLWLSHCPIHPNELRGHNNVHGHVHDKTLEDNRYFNCCVENVDYTPISLEDVRKRLQLVII